MNIILFGATGMVGQGVLRECLLDPTVDRVLAVGRNATGQQHPKLRDLVVSDVANLSSVENELAGYDACLFCLGVSSAGMDEATYTKLTHDLTLSVAKTLVRINPNMTFIYVSGASTDSTEKGKSMWARVKGRTENELMALGFKAAYMFRPAMIIPMHGIKSRTKWVRIFYAVMKPFNPLMKALMPGQVLTTEGLGKAMLNVVRNGYSKPILEAKDITSVAT